MTTVDFRHASRDELHAAVVATTVENEVHGEQHTAMAKCAIRGCTTIFLGRGDFDAADHQAEAEGWTIDGPDAFCPVHTP